MQYTPNYNLITVEGTDIVNPLIQMNPNFTDIDTAMFANKQAVIGTATELTSGTVHSITRLNPDSNYFRFTATSNWNAGDTFSIDGVAVSAFTPDGKTLSQGCYVINSEVFAILNGTRLTVFVDSAVSLSNLTDTAITTPADNDALVYDNGSWSNKHLDSSDITYNSGSVKDALNAANTVEVLATAHDTYNGAWTLMRCGHVYTLSIYDTAGQTIPPGLIRCPFSVDPSWLPSYRSTSMSITQDGHIWNIGATSTGIQGWMYTADTSQRFATVTWVK